MITVLLLLPVVATLLWLYWYLLPQRRWGRFDFVLVFVLTVLTGTMLWMIEKADWQGAGPLWPKIVAATGAYLIFTVGLAGGLIWRRR